MAILNFYSMRDSRPLLSNALWAWILLATLSQAQTATPANASALEQQGKFGEAATAWRSITRQTPGDARAFASLGLDLSKQGEYEQAALAYKKALALNPRLPGVQLDLGLAEFKQGKFQAAIGPLKGALASDPKSLQADTLLGLSYYGSRQFNEASQYLGAAARSDPANVELQQVLAQSCLAVKKYSCALNSFHKILERNPESAGAHVLAGEALDGLGRTPEAILEFQTAIKAAPTEPDLHFGLGYLHWKSHQYNDAKAAFEEELAINPSNSQAFAYLGDIEMKANNFDRALSLLRKAEEGRSDIRIAYIDMGSIFTEQKRYPEAITALQHAKKLDPQQPDAHFKLGRVYQAMGDKVASQREFATVRELHEKADESVTAKMPRPAPALNR